MLILKRGVRKERGEEIFLLKPHGHFSIDTHYLSRKVVPLTTLPRKVVSGSHTWRLPSSIDVCIAFTSQVVPVH